MRYIIQEETEDGTSEAIGGPDFNYIGAACLWVFGTFDGCTVTVEQAPPEVDEWFPLLDSNGDPAAFTSKAQRDFFSLKGRRLRVVITGAASQTSVSVLVT